MFDELRRAMHDYMVDNCISKTEMAKKLDCCYSKMDFFVPRFDESGNIVQRVHERPTLREPMLSKLLTILRDAGYIERRIYIPACDRVAK